MHTLLMLGSHTSTLTDHGWQYAWHMTIELVVVSWLRLPRAVYPGFSVYLLAQVNESSASRRQYCLVWGAVPRARRSHRCIYWTGTPPQGSQADLEEHMVASERHSVGALRYVYQYKNALLSHIRSTSAVTR